MRPPRQSDIFDAYAKLAEEKGLVKVAAEDKESKELKDYKNSVSARAGSDDISIIEALYGVKPDTIKGMEYERNIIEVAHPNAVVISPAYDKLNGLVENLNERADIIRNKIMSKAPSGGIIFHKEAKNDLMMQLVRIGNDMDNADEEDIRCLADECLEGLKKKADFFDDVSNYAHKAVNYIGGNKLDRLVTDIGGVGEGAATGAAIGAVLTSWLGPGAMLGAGLGAVVGGIGGFLFNTSSKVKNIRENSRELLDQVEDIKKYVPEEQVFFTSIENMATSLVKASDDYIVALNVVRNKELKNEAATPAELEEVKKDTKIFVDLIGSFEKNRETFLRKAKEGAFAKSLNSIPHPGIANDIEDVTDAFNTLAVAIDNLKATMTGIGTEVIQEAKQQPAQQAQAPVPADKPKSALPESLNNDFDRFWENVGQKPDAKTMEFFNSLPEYSKK